MAFTQKKLSASFELAQGVFSGGKNAASISDLRMSLIAQFNGGESQGNAELTIFGLPLQMMNQLSTVGTQYNQVSKNKMSIFAQEGDGAQNLVYQGQILSAFVDGAAMPDVAFRVQLTPAIFDAVKPAKALSIKGSADVASTVQNLAKQAGMSFENAGVKAKLSNPYFSGSVIQQILAVARHANVDVTFDKGTCAIVDPKKSRQGTTPLISKETGMIGYPAFTSAGIIVTCLYNPEVKHFAEIEIKSDLTPANGKWKVINMTLDLQSQTPHGKWNMILETTTPSSGTA